MIINASVLKNEECVAFRLRDLYRAHGFAQFKMSKFEEYDLYARNKHFLVSENVITFTDTDGKLMALKPDVTLSIIKNTKDEENGAQKVYYDENVYRVSKGTHAFRELTQVGLECIGDVDEYCIAEVLTLAADSLGAISDDYVLDVSDLDLLGDALQMLGVDEAVKDEMLHCIGEKNFHGVAQIAAREGVAKEKTDALVALLGIGGGVRGSIEKLKTLLPQSIEKIAHLERVMAVLADNERVRFDFSVVNDMSYYNGIVFKGFINGVPAGVLSGGQYDRLMEKMGLRSRAIGFAVYLDQLERFGSVREELDAETVLLYDDDCDPAALCRAAQQLCAQNKRVTVRKTLPQGFACKEILVMKNGEVCVNEDNA
jgi:ATP phosphoribosyltransferase regulatory subunit